MFCLVRFQVHYDTASAVSLKGDESTKFAAVLDGIIAKQSGIMSALEKSAKKSMLLESPRVTQSPMVWLNIRGAAHASLVESEPMGESQVTINAFEAPHAALLSPEELSAPFESYDFYVENGSAALANLTDILLTAFTGLTHATKRNRQSFTWPLRTLPLFLSGCLKVLSGVQL